MISPFMVYLVMQADVIVFASGLVGGILFVIGSVVFLFAKSEDDANVFVPAKWGAISGIILLIVSALFPNTKTMAAMIIIPAMTSDKAIELVSPEAGELYNLAKDAIRSHIKLDNPKDAEKEK